MLHGGAKLFVLKSFRSDVKQLELTPDRLLDAIPLNIGGNGAVDNRGRYVVSFEMIHLVFHQGDERGDDECQPGKCKRGKLITKRFTATRRHDTDHVLARENKVHNLPLRGPEFVETKLFSQKIANVHDLPSVLPATDRKGPNPLDGCGLV